MRGVRLLPCEKKFAQTDADAFVDDLDTHRLVFGQECACDVGFADVLADAVENDVGVSEGDFAVIQLVAVEASVVYRAETIKCAHVPLARLTGQLPRFEEADKIQYFARLRFR